MLALRRKIDFSEAKSVERQSLLQRQWLVTNGLGGYASGTIGGAITWRYHGLLVAALPAPFGRTTMLNHLEEWLRCADGRAVQFGGSEASYPGESELNYLVEFRIENQLPCWRYDIEGVLVEKRVLMPHRQNTVHITYSLLSRQAGCRLDLRPSIHFRPFEADVGTPLRSDYEVRARGQCFEIHVPGDLPPLRLFVAAEESRFIQDGGSQRQIVYQRDAERGYESRGSLWSPGYFSAALRREPVTLIASTESWHTISALDPEAALMTEQMRLQRLLRQAHPSVQQGLGAELVLAADQFIIVPAGRVKDAARARAAGEELRSVIAGYHWFTDWGRDTMIGLEGLALTTGRHQEAAWILRTFAHYVRDGLIPNMFPEGKTEGLYHTADATLWFFHAVHRYVETTGDRELLASLLPVLREIAGYHLRGTKFGIGVDPADGLLRQGAAGYQLTWMDAKVGDWVVTPRRGKAVEINALWYNALKLLESWLRSAGDLEADSIAQHAQRAYEAFNARFWNANLECLYDVVDGENGDDAAIRPNQVLAIALQHPVLASERWASVMHIVEKKLLTPIGLRTLSRDHPNYKSNYSGDLRARDAAYHQGTVWPWLIGPFINAWLRVHPGECVGARRFLTGFAAHLDDGCVGTIAEIFDAEEPFVSRGCISQAWSVAEVLRCFALTADEP